jgi:hypothetical protein
MLTEGVLPTLHPKHPQQLQVLLLVLLLLLLQQLSGCTPLAGSKL